MKILKQCKKLFKIINNENRFDIGVVGLVILIIALEEMFWYLH